MYKDTFQLQSCVFAQFLWLAVNCHYNVCALARLCWMHYTFTLRSRSLATRSAPYTASVCSAFNPVIRLYFHWSNSAFSRIQKQCCTRESNQQLGSLKTSPLTVTLHHCHIALLLIPYCNLCETLAVSKQPGPQEPLTRAGSILQKKTNLAAIEAGANMAPRHIQTCVYTKEEVKR